MITRIHFSDRCTALQASLRLTTFLRMLCSSLVGRTVLVVDEHRITILSPVFSCFQNLLSKPASNSLLGRILFKADSAWFNFVQIELPRLLNFYTCLPLEDLQNSTWKFWHRDEFWQICTAASNSGFIIIVHKYSLLSVSLPSTPFSESTKLLVCPVVGPVSWLEACWHVHSCPCWVLTG